MKSPKHRYTREEIHDLGQTIIGSPRERYVLTIGQYAQLSDHAAGCALCSDGFSGLRKIGARFTNVEWTYTPGSN